MRDLSLTLDPRWTSFDIQPPKWREERGRYEKILREKEKEKERKEKE